MEVVPVAVWVKQHPPKDKLAKLYLEEGSIVRLAKRLKVSRSTVHAWLHAAGVDVRPRGTDEIRRAANALRRAGLTRKARPERGVSDPNVDTERRHCHQNRHWDGVVILCINTAGPVCVTCTRGYVHGLKEVLNSSTGAEQGTHTGRRKGVPSRS